jgi:hypothetical protein
VLYPLSYGRALIGTASLTCLHRCCRLRRGEQADALLELRLPRACHEGRRPAASIPVTRSPSRASTSTSATGSRGRASRAHDGSAIPVRASDSPPRDADRGNADRSPRAARAILRDRASPSRGPPRAARTSARAEIVRSSWRRLRPRARSWTATSTTRSTRSLYRSRKTSTRP